MSGERRTGASGVFMFKSRGSRLETNLVKVSCVNGQFKATVPKGVAESCGIIKGSVLRFTAYQGGLIRIDIISQKVRK